MNSTFRIGLIMANENNGLRVEKGQQVLGYFWNGQYRNLLSAPLVVLNYTPWHYTLLPHM